MYTCAGALVHSRVLGRASRPSAIVRSCVQVPVLESGVRANFNRLPTYQTTRTTSASSPRSTRSAQRLGRGPFAYTYTQTLQGLQGIQYLQCRTQVVPPWAAIDAGGCHGRVTAHSSTQLTVPTISLIETICCNVTPSWQLAG